MKFAAMLGLALGVWAAPLPGSPPSQDPDLLVTEAGSTPLTHTATLALMDQRSLLIEPGIRMTRASDAYSLSTFDGRPVQLSIGRETILLASPVTARLGQAGWDFGNGQIYASSSVTARRKAQDDADTNLKSMQESAQKLKSQPRIPREISRKLRVRWIYGENPLVTSELFNSEALLPLSHISAIGF